MKIKISRNTIEKNVKILTRISFQSFLLCIDKKTGARQIQIPQQTASLF